MKPLLVWNCGVWNCVDVAYRTPVSIVCHPGRGVGRTPALAYADWKKRNVPWWKPVWRWF